MPLRMRDDALWRSYGLHAVFDVSLSTLSLCLSLRGSDVLIEHPVATSLFFMHERWHSYGLYALFDVSRLPSLSLSLSLAHTHTLISFSSSLWGDFLPYLTLLYVCMSDDALAIYMLSVSLTLICVWEMTLLRSMCRLWRFSSLLFCLFSFTLKCVWERWRGYDLHALSDVSRLFFFVFFHWLLCMRPDI